MRHDETLTRQNNKRNSTMARLLLSTLRYKARDQRLPRRRTDDSAMSDWASRAFILLGG